MNKNVIISVVVIIVIIIAGYYLMGGGNSALAPTPSPTVTGVDVGNTGGVIISPTTLVGSPTPSTTSSGKVVTVDVTASNFSFDPKTIKVKKGDTVKIVLHSKGGFHDWVIDEFNAATKRINGNETTTVEFVANKVGSFEYYCSVGTHRQMGMKGTLVVE